MNSSKKEKTIFAVVDLSSTYEGISLRVSSDVCWPAPLASCSAELLGLGVVMGIFEDRHDALSVKSELQQGDAAVASDGYTANEMLEIIEIPVFRK